MDTSAFWARKRVVVGGGCGLIGSYLVPELVDRTAEVTVVDNLEHGRVEHLDPVRDRIRVVEGDLRDLAVCDRVTRDQQAFINLAARAYGMAYSHAHHGEMLVQNLLTGLTPLEAARMNGVERYVIVSSSCVYPDGAPVPTSELDVFTGKPEGVNEGYGWAKRIQELAGQYYAREHGMKVTVVRPFNVYGGNYRWDASEKAHVIPALVRRVVDGEDPLVVWGSGDQRRNFLHGRDAARLLIKIIEAGPLATPVNVGFEEDTTIREIVQLICEAVGARPSIVFDVSRPEGPPRKCADATRLRDVTGGYEPQISLRAGIAEVVESYRRSTVRTPTHPSS